MAPALQRKPKPCSAGASKARKRAPASCSRQKPRRRSTKRRPWPTTAAPAVSPQKPQRQPQRRQQQHRPPKRRPLRPKLPPWRRRHCPTACGPGIWPLQPAARHPRPRWRRPKRWPLHAWRATEPPTPRPACTWPVSRHGMPAHWPRCWPPPHRHRHRPGIHRTHAWPKRWPSWPQQWPRKARSSARRPFPWLCPLAAPWQGHRAQHRPPIPAGGQPTKWRPAWRSWWRSTSAPIRPAWHPRCAVKPRASSVKRTA